MSICPCCSPACLPPLLSCPCPLPGLPRRSVQTTSMRITYHELRKISILQGIPWFPRPLNFLLEKSSMAKKYHTLCFLVDSHVRQHSKYSKKTCLVDFLCIFRNFLCQKKLLLLLLILKYLMPSRESVCSRDYCLGNASTGCRRIPPIQKSKI